MIELTKEESDELLHQFSDDYLVSFNNGSSRVNRYLSWIEIHHMPVGGRGDISDAILANITFDSFGDKITGNEYTYTYDYGYDLLYQFITKKIRDIKLNSIGI
jgi:hypothetical protein